MKNRYRPMLVLVGALSGCEQAVITGLHCTEETIVEFSSGREMPDELSISVTWDGGEAACLLDRADEGSPGCEGIELRGQTTESGELRTLEGLRVGGFAPESLNLQIVADQVTLYDGAVQLKRDEAPCDDPKAQTVYDAGAVIELAGSGVGGVGGSPD